MDYKLKDILKTSRFGPSLKPSKIGDTQYLQLKHFNFSNNKLSDIDSFVDLDKKLNEHLLITGDILFVTKGIRYFAWRYDKIVGQAFASSTFLVLHPNQEIIAPHFLELYLNLPQVIEEISRLSL